MGERDLPQAARRCGVVAFGAGGRQVKVEQVNGTRYRPGQAAGHYESFFQRANHPERPLAFWIRYTIFSPRGRPAEAVGELWAIFFDGESGRHIAVKEAHPFGECAFETGRFFVQVAGAKLESHQLHGQAASAGHAITWELAYGGNEKPLLLLPERLYLGGFPKAKSLVGLPLAVFDGSLAVDGRVVPVEGWTGSQNHNWGSQHTDFYAWGQVAGFDGRPDTFLEVASARLKFGPIWTPFITPIVLRHQGEEIALNALSQTVRARASLDYFTWRFRSATKAATLEGSISATREAFVGLRYSNPPGGFKQCLNSKIAACHLTLTRPGSDGRPTVEQFSTQHRAAFEILTDDTGHGVPIQS